MKAEEFWDLYMNSTDNTLDIYDEAMAFFAKELPDNFIEEYDVVEVVLEIQGHHETAKKFEKFINFVSLIKEKQPDLYEVTSVYSNDFLISYYAFHNNNIEVENVFTDASKNVAANYDNFLIVFKKLLFYQYVEIIEKAVDLNIEEVCNSEDLLEGAEYDLVILKLFNTIEKYYLESLTSTVFEKEKIVKELVNYNFDSKDLEKSLSLFEKGFYDKSLDLKSVQQIISKSKPEAMYILQAQFMKVMLQKNFRFAVSARIWELMMTYWNQNNENSKNYFEIDLKKFDKYLVNLSGGMFLDNKSEMFALLWGSVYVYDFLFEMGLIDSQIYTNFIAASRELKGVLIANQSSLLWECNFLHKWQKPNSVLETEFEAETKIFEKSLNFNHDDFSEFKKEIESELATIGQLSEYIIKGESKIAENQSEKERIFNSYFDDKKDFFIPPSNLKPIIKEANEKINRNDPCHCGSGKKFKKCCM